MNNAMQKYLKTGRNLKFHKTKIESSGILIQKISPYLGNDETSEPNLYKITYITYRTVLLRDRFL